MKPQGKRALSRPVITLMLASAALVAHAQAQSPAPLFNIPVTPGGAEDAALGDFNEDGKVDVAGIQGGTARVFLNQGAGKFTPATPVVTDEDLTALVAADFDHDGHLDVAAAAFFSDSVTVLLGDGHGNLALHATITDVLNPSEITAIDLDDNGDVDLATTSGFGYKVVLLLGDGDGGFAETGSLDGNSGASSILAADFDGNGLQDVATTTTDPFLSPGTINVFLHTSLSTFVTYSYPGDGYPVDMVVGDVAGDSAPDLIVANQAGSSLEILVGSASGTFAPMPKIALPKAPSSIAIGDLDHDGQPDLVTRNAGSESVTLLLGQGGGAFTQHEVTCAIPQFSGVAELVDLDLDGWQDVLVTSLASLRVIRGLGDGTLAESGCWAAGDSPSAVLSGDFDGDGTPDLAVANRDTGTVSVLLGGPEATFEAPKTSNAGLTPVGLAAGHFDADGHLDVATVNSDGESVSILLGHGDGTFADPVDVPINTGTPRAIVALHADLDANLDLVTADQYNTMTLLKGHGDGTFTNLDALGTGNEPSAITSADLDGDGHADIITTSPVDGAVDITLSKGNGFFFTHTSVPMTGEPRAVAAGLIDSDALTDLAVVVGNVLPGSDAVIVLYGLGGGSYTASPAFQVGPQASGVALADFNGDGRTDIATADLGSDAATVLLADPVAGFVANGSFGTGSLPAGVCAADFSGDGRPDLALANSGSHTVAVLTNQGPSPWADLGHALAGSQGLPLLVGGGTLEPGSLVGVGLSNAKPSGATFLVAGAAAQNAPLKGGVLVPQLTGPGSFVLLTVTDGDGVLALDHKWPLIAPSGFTIYLQAWIVDAAGPQGLAASNGLSGTTP